MGRTLPPNVSINDLERHTEVPERNGMLEDSRHYGDEAECAVCGKPLDRAPHPEGLDLCGNHTEEDYREMVVHDERVRDEEMTARDKRAEEEFAQQQDYYNER